MVSVAVIGAGMAGMACASQLNQLGFTSVEVFEGSERIGGRIHPIPYHGGYLQMGAQYINGEENPIYDIAKKLGVLGRAESDLEHIERADFKYGKQSVDPADLKLFMKFIEPLDSKYRSFASDYELMSRSYTFRTLFLEDYERFIKEHEISGQRAKVFEALVRTYRSYWEFEWSADWSDLSLSVLRHWNDHGPAGESFLTDKIGYKAILDYVYTSISSAKFHFNSTVTNIDYSGKKVRLTTKEMGPIAKEFDHVIVTCSLGHLKRFHKSLFTPELPSYKREAIDKIGFGGSCKIFFRWEQPFWSSDTYSLAPLPVEGMARTRLSPFEAELTTLQDEEIINETTQLMRDMMNDQTISPPSEMIRTKLTKNDLLCGAYSYVSHAQAQGNLSNELLERPMHRGSQPLVLFAGEATHDRYAQAQGNLSNELLERSIHRGSQPLVLFAGEATRDRLFQTAVGAYLSGIREANRLAGMGTFRSKI